MLIDLPIRHTSNGLRAQQNLAMPGLPHQRHDQLPKQAMCIDLLFVHQGQAHMHYLTDTDPRRRSQSTNHASQFNRPIHRLGLRMWPAKMSQQGGPAGLT